MKGLHKSLPNLKTARGFTLIEILIAAVILVVAVIGIAAIFPTGYKDVSSAGQITMATAAAQMALDGMQNLPIASILNLNGFNTAAGAAGLPAADPERTLARLWAFALTGDQATWAPPAGSPQYTLGINAGVALGATGTITVSCLNAAVLPNIRDVLGNLQVVIPCPADPWLVFVTVNVTVPQRPGNPALVTRLVSNAAWL